MQAPEQIQAEYYDRTAKVYDSMHVADKEHDLALRVIESLSGVLGLSSFLDVGAGTGRGVRYLLDRDKKAVGIEPVQSLIDQGIAGGLPPETLIHGNGASLPYPDQSFDAVCEFAVLHHVAKPEQVVSEMMRVAKKAVFLSDSNRFGQGAYAARLLKVALYRTGLWQVLRYVQTGGKMYTISPGDGLGYSYSVYDNFELLSGWAEQIWTVGTQSNSRHSSWFGPILNSRTVLLCAVKSPKEGRNSGITQDC